METGFDGSSLILGISAAKETELIFNAINIASKALEKIKVERVLGLKKSIIVMNMFLSISPSLMA